MFKWNYFLLFICLLTAIPLGNVYAQPKIIVGDGEALNFGEINVPPKMYEAKVAIRNAGDDTLYIHRIDRNCRCTDFTLSSEIIPPGEFSTVQLKINFDIDRSSGPRSTQLRFYSNDPVDSVVVFECKADVHRPIVVEPTSFPKLLGVRAGNWSRSKLKVTNNGDEALLFGEPTYIDSRDQELHFEVLLDGQPLVPGQPLAAGATVELTMRFMAEEAGRYSGQLTFPLMGEENHEFEADFTTIIDHADGRPLYEVKIESDAGTKPHAGH